MTAVDTGEFGDVLPRPQYDVEIAHGYTLKQINGLSLQAAKLCDWVNGMEMTHRAVTAWSAIVEHLQLVYSRPEETELIATGWKEMKAQHPRTSSPMGWEARTAPWSPRPTFPTGPPSPLPRTATRAGSSTLWRWRRSGLD
jgi:hypothetical protein